MTIKPLPSALPLAGWVNQTILSRYNPCTRECTSSYSKEKMTWQQGRRALMTLCHCQPELSPIPSLWLALIALKLLAQEAKITNSTETNTAWCHCSFKPFAQTCCCGTNTKKTGTNTKLRGKSALPDNYYFKLLACLHTPPTRLVGYLGRHWKTPNKYICCLVWASPDATCVAAWLLYQW